MKAKNPVAFLFLVLAMSMLPLSAQATDLSGRSFLSLFSPQTEAGIQILGLSPQNDLRTAVDGRLGFEVGVHWAIDLDGGNELRPRIDYSRYDGGAFSMSSISSTTTIQGISVGADYVRYLDISRRGMYGVAGINLTWWNCEYRFQDNERKTSPTVQIGVGHRFNKALSMEFDLDYGQFRSSMGSESSIKFGAFYKF